MTEHPRVEVDRQNSRGWVFPAYEQGTANVQSIRSRSGRNSERDQFDYGRADITLRVDRDDLSYDPNLNEEPEYVNGFTRLNLDYLSEVEGNIVAVADSEGQTILHPASIGSVTVEYEFGTQGWEWQLGRDREYWAQVEEYKEYVISLYVQDLLGDDDNFDMYLKVYWFTETGGYISDEWFNKINTPVDVETRIHARAIAPANAAYCSIGIRSNGSALADFKIRYRKFMIHEYDEAYDIANGTPVKPYANQDIYDASVDASTPIRTVFPGNQYNINKAWPSSTIGAGPYDREMSTINLAPPIYDMDTFANSTEVTNNFLSTRMTKSLITTDAHNGTQCMRIQTLTSGSGSWVIWFSSGQVAYNIPTVPGKTYEFSFWAKNKAVAGATFTFSVKNQNAVSTTLAGNQTIPGSSGWIKYSGTWTCPADNYTALLWMFFNAGNYDVYIDQIEAYETDAGEEPGMTHNYWSRFGDLEQSGFSSLFMKNQMSKNPGMLLKDRYDVTAGSPAGPRVIRATKPAASTAGDFYYGNNSSAWTARTEGGRAYSFKFKARKVSGTNPELLLYARPNSALYTDSFTFVNKVTFTNSDWAEYSFTWTPPARSSATNFAMVVSGVLAEEVNIEIDDIRLVRFQEELVSNTINGLERTTTYQFEARDGKVDFYISYGNDLYDDAGILYRTYHSGKTRTRYSVTLTSINKDAPVGTVAHLVWATTNGRGTVFNGQSYRGVVNYDSQQAITLPTGGGSVTITGLAPDIPWRGVAPMIRMEMPSNGAYTIGYKFEDEYIGPDGYEDYPEIQENVRFAGAVRERLDDVKSMSIDGKRFYDIELTCVDNYGALSLASMQTPYQQGVLRHEPLTYIPFNDSNLTEMSGRLTNPPFIYSKGTPSSWGAEYDSDVELVGTGEGGSWKFTPSGNDYTGQVVKVTDNAISRASASDYLQTLGIWFSHTASIGAFAEEVLFSQLNEKDVLQHGAYAAVTADGIKLGVDGPIHYVGRPELALDGEPHYVVIAYDDEDARIYLDGELINIDSVIFSRFTTTFIGGEVYQGEFTKMFNGNIGHFELYDYKLTADQVYDHWVAGKNLRKGETEVERITHILDLANQSNIPPIVRDRDGNIPESLTTMTSPEWNNDTAPSVVMTDIARSIGGQIFSANNGAMVYENRSQRWNNGGDANQSWLIGVGSDIQPEVDSGLQVGPDISKVINEAIITVKNLDVDQGAVQRVSNEKSIRRHQKVTYKETYDVNTPDEAKYAAEWLVATNDKPYPRYSQLVFNGHANDATAEFCRRVRISDHVYGELGIENGLDGGVISGFVENIQEEIRQEGSVMLWITTIQLSPAQNQLVWKLEDPTYGGLDSGNRLAY